VENNLLSPGKQPAKKPDTKRR